MGLNSESQSEVDKLLRLIGSDADPHTAEVVTAYANRLPLATLARVRESTGHSAVRDRAAYAVALLLSETGRGKR